MQLTVDWLMWMPLATGFLIVAFLNSMPSCDLDFLDFFWKVLMSSLFSPNFPISYWENETLSYILPTHQVLRRKRRTFWQNSFACDISLFFYLTNKLLVTLKNQHLWLKHRQYQLAQWSNLDINCNIMKLRKLLSSSSLSPFLWRC